MGQNQCHCEDYQILIPTIIHGSELDLEWPRYQEIWDDAQINASLTSESHNFWSDHWISKFHTFLEIGSQDFSKGVRINLILGLLRPSVLEGLLVTFQGLTPQNACRGYK